MLTNVMQVPATMDEAMALRCKRVELLASSITL